MKKDTGLLILRVSFAGFMIYGHGWGKLIGFSEIHSHFPDPFGVGPSISLALAVFAEFFCAIAVAVGWMTRLAVVPLVTTMAVAAFMIHGADPFDKMEKALLFLAGYICVALLGPGKFSVDGALGKDRGMG